MINRLAVVGLGKLGSCIAATFANSGFYVVATDIDDNKRLAIANRVAPVDELGLQELLEKIPELNLSTTTNYCHLVDNSDACFFVLPTPSLNSGRFDNSYLATALATVASEVLNQKKANYIFVINSTVNPGSCQNVFTPLLKDILGDLPFKLYYKPELIALGNVLYDLIHPDFVMIGDDGSSAFSASQDIIDIYMQVVCPQQEETTYCKFNYKLFKMPYIDIELAKISLNCFITMKISFANQLAAIAKKFNTDASSILHMIGHDSRIGTKCLRPGLPFGGPCFPRDNRMFIAAADYAPLAEATDRVNNGLKYDIFNQVTRLAQKVRTSSIGILGMAYKPRTSVTDQSLGLYLQNSLEDDGYEVHTYDPQAKCNSTKEQVLECKVIVVACAWEEFRTLVVDKDKVALIDPENVISQAVYA